jgi:hypothetical protein
MRPPETNDANKKALIGQSGLDSPQVVTSEAIKVKDLKLRVIGPSGVRVGW